MFFSIIPRFKADGATDVNVVPQALRYVQRYGLDVAFHYFLKKDFLSTYNAASKHLSGYRMYAKWLAMNDISYTDISEEQII